MSTKPLLGLLSDGQVHSGESLAAELGVSRTAIWKQVGRLQGKGVAIETIRGRGYRLAGSVDLLDNDTIRSRLPAPVSDRVRLVVLDEVDSTNTDISRRWRQGEDGILVTLADTQSAGRGRRGRVWQSPPGQNLYLSFGMQLARGFTSLDGLSLVVGCAIADALEAMGASDLGLKWPNDLVHERGKLAGVLIELQGELEGSAQVIIGVGMNIHMTATEGVDQPWTSLDLLYPEQTWKRNAVAAAVVASVVESVDRFVEQGFAPFHAQWARRDTLRARELVAAGGELQGLGEGIDDAGNYLVRTAEGVRAVHAGEISLRMRS